MTDFRTSDLGRMMKNRRKQLLIPRDQPQTGNINDPSNTCSKYESESEIKQNSGIVPAADFKLEATVKVENFTTDTDSHVGNLVKREILEFDNMDGASTDNDLNQNHSNAVVFEKIPKIETHIDIVGDGDGDGGNLYTSGSSDNDPNSDSDPERDRDPFEDVDLDPSFSKHPRIHNSNDSSAATQVQLINPADSNDSSKNPSTSPKWEFPTTSATGNRSQYERKLKALNSKLHCQLCLDSRYSKTWLKTHVETCAKSHRDRYRFCIPCNTLFCNNGAYRQHSLRIHGIQVPKVKECIFKCQFCPCSFALKDILVAHLASHPEINTTDKEDLKRWPYRCQECPSTFRFYSVYTLHMLSHRNELAFKCPEPNCGKAFKNNGSLKTHLQLCHSDAKPFACPEPNCGSTFKTKAQLQNHVVCHSEERPFKCSHSNCCKTFKRKDRLKHHSALHTEARRLKHMAQLEKMRREAPDVFTVGPN